MARAPRLPRVPPTAARIGQLRKRITRNRRSNSGLGGDAASTAASMLIDFISGFFDIIDEVGARSQVEIKLPEVIEDLKRQLQEIKEEKVTIHF